MRAHLALAVAAAAALALTACTDDSGGSASAVAETDDAEIAGDTVTVEAVGSVEGTPDVITALVGVEVAADDVDTAYTEGNEAAAAVRDALLESGVADEDLQTARLSLRTDRHHGPRDGDEGPPQYVARTELRAELRDLDAAGAILDEAVAAADGHATLRSLGFSLDDDSELVVDAREAAFEEARAKAAQYADLADRQLGALVGLSESDDARRRPPEPVPADLTRAEDDAAGPPVEPGQEEVQVRVRATWALD